MTKDRNGILKELEAQKEHLAHPEETEQYLHLMEDRAEEKAAAMREGKREGENMKVARRSANPIGSPVRTDTQHAFLPPITLLLDVDSASSNSGDSDGNSDAILSTSNEEDKEEQTVTNESGRWYIVSDEEVKNQVLSEVVDTLALEQQQQKQTLDQIRASAPTTKNPFVIFARWVKSLFE